MLFGAHVVGVQRDFLIGPPSATVASSGCPSRPLQRAPASGGDSGADRWGMRPDSITVASIDAETGPHRADRPPAQHGGLPVPSRARCWTSSSPTASTCEGQLPERRLSTWARRPRRLCSKARPSARCRRHRDRRRGHHRTASMNYWAMVNLGRVSVNWSMRSAGWTLRRPPADPRRPRPPTPHFGYIEPESPASSPATTRCGSPEPATALTTTPGWPGRSACCRRCCNQVSPQSDRSTNFAGHRQRVIRDGLHHLRSEARTGSADGAGRQGQGPSRSRHVSLVPPHDRHRAPRHPVGPAQGHRRRSTRVRRHGLNLARYSRKSQLRRAKHAPAADPLPAGLGGTLNDGYAANESDDLGAASC
jgi:hypothetical protein